MVINYVRWMLLSDSEMFRLLKSFMPILRSAKQHDVLGFGSTYGGFRGAVGLISEINHL